jgi:beta-1,4-mannooligosaccharide/beta-1,4-mannosyl-N-acetylglucosamine phosphorylase
VGSVLKGRPHYWDERIGSGPPPVKTREGWLHLYHGIATHFGSVNIYQAGACLLDLEDPSRVLARGSKNILEPREGYELVGQVPNVVFPSGMVVEGSEGDGFASKESRVLVYYGAADTCIGLATTTVGELIQACHD